jgi:hypothetical protein
VTFSRAWRLGRNIGVPIGVVAGTITIARNWATVESALEWLYPIGVIVLMGVALIAALAVIGYLLRPTKDYANEAEREHDRRIVGDARTYVNRDQVTWLASQDFGAAWEGERVGPFWNLVQRLPPGPENVPFDPELRRTLDELRRVTAEFLNFYALNTFGERSSVDDRDWRNIGWSSMEADDLRGGEREHWNTRRNGLHERADAVEVAYNDFVDAARRAHVLDAAAR